MKKFFTTRPDTVVLTLGVVLGIIILGAYALGITHVAEDLNLALNPDKANVAAPTYNLEAAAKLNLKGLISGQ